MNLLKEPCESMFNIVFCPAGMEEVPKMKIYLEG